MATWPWKVTPCRLAPMVLCWTLICWTLATTGPALAQDSAAGEPEWLLNTLKDSLTVAPGDTLTLDHPLGDVRVKTAETDRVQVTAIAQYHTDDPRVPTMRFVPGSADKGASEHGLKVEFPHMEIAEQEGWSKRRIDVGLLVPKGLRMKITTADGMIEMKAMEAAVELKSVRGEIIYEGKGDVTAHSDRGAVRAHLGKTGPKLSVDLSTLTGDVWVILLEGASAQVELSTRGPVTTDYSIELDRKSGSLLKQGRAKFGKKGTQIQLKSHSGGIRLQGLIAPEPSS